LTMCCNPNVYDESNPLLGVVLSGGKSSRMGNDKGLLLKDGTSWVKDCLDKIERLGVPVSISINSSQAEQYSSIVDPELLIVDHVPVNGPLGGILSVHDKFPNHDLVVVACDLPDLSTDLIKDLINEYDERSGEHDFFVYKINNEAEPLVGVYTAEGLQKIASLFLSNQLEKHSMKYILEVGNTYFLDLKEERWKEFKNYNYKEDLL
jgi:molybdenum cofactor guanylyltransferase